MPFWIPEKHKVTEPNGLMSRPWMALFTQITQILGTITTPGGLAPSDAEYIVASSDGTLTAERVATDTPTVAWDFTNPATAEPDVLVTAFVLRGTRAAQPAAADVPEGTTYFVTDDKVTERSNGSVWQVWSTAQTDGTHTNIVIAGKVQALGTGLIEPTSAEDDTGYHSFEYSGEGVGGGTSDLTGFQAKTAIVGTNDVANMYGWRGRAANNLTSGSVTNNQVGGEVLVENTGGGHSANVIALQARSAMSGAGNVTGTLIFFRPVRGAPSGAGDILGSIYGYTCPDIGRAACTTVVCFNADDQTKGSAALLGYRSQVTSGSGRWNLYIDGTAQNYLRGNVGIGVGKSTPSVALDVAGDILASGTITGAPSYASALMLMG